MMDDYSSDLHDLDTMGDELVIEGTTTPKWSSHILKDSLSDSDLLILMDIAKRNGCKKHCFASDIEMGRSPKASIGVESEIHSPSFFVDAMGGLCSEIREMNVIQLHIKTTGLLNFWSGSGCMNFLKEPCIHLNAHKVNRILISCIGSQTLETR
ncbi:hypothetical protein ACSBR2_039841 [Camellia fascicularis]